MEIVVEGRDLGIPGFENVLREERSRDALFEPRGL